MTAPRPLLLPALAVWPCQLAACAVLVFAGLGKVRATPADVQLFTLLEMEPYGRVVVGVLELLAALGLLHPLSAAYGALLGVGVLTGAALAHFGPLGLGGIEVFLPTYGALLVVLVGRWRALPFAAG